MTLSTFSPNNNTLNQTFFNQLELPLLNLSHPPVYSAHILQYFQYYQIHFTQAVHYFGKFHTNRFDIAAHIFTPARPKGTIVLLHGYLDHTGIMKHCIKFCIEQGYNAALFDLPGHGMSSGQRVHITGFSEYTQILNAFIELCRSSGLAAPFHAIGISTGGAILLDYLYHTHNSKADLESIILLAPLVRFALWHLSKAGIALIGKFIRLIPRKIPTSSSDQEFIHFLRQDPLRGRYVHLDWLKALFSWEAAMQSQPCLTKPVMVIQGTKDTTVDWKYNIPFLQQKLNNMTFIAIPNARHQLINESFSYRLEVIKHIQRYLEDGAETG